MEYIVSFKNITFKYGEKTIFDNLNLTIKRGSFTSIIGTNGSGKSTLIRLMLGLIKAKGVITIDGVDLGYKTLKHIIRKIGVVFENPDNQFVAETVMDDMAFSLENLQMSAGEIREKIKIISQYLSIDSILEREPHRLSGGEKQLVALASALIIEPDILILDEALTMVDEDTKIRIYRILKEINEQKGTTIINVTHDMNELIYGTDIIVLDKGSVVLNDIKDNVLLEEKKFNDLGLDLPFMVSLSIKLKYYNLIDRLIYDMDEMVGVLWK